jgi:hypothetical protein
MTSSDEKSWYDQAGEWVEQKYDQVTGNDQSGYDQGPVTVPYEEPTADQQADWHRQAELSDYITSVVGPLKQEAANVEQAASIIQGTSDSSTREEIEGLAGQCATLSSQGYTAAHQLTQAGVQDWVYSVKACNEVGYWANSAATHVQSAAASEYPTEIHGYLTSAVNDLSNAAASINGA